MNPSLRGVAKINIARDVIPQYFYDFVNVSRATFGETVKLIRPAGTFPHANIFGGFLMVAIFAAYVLWSRGIKKILPRVLLAASFPIFLAALLVTFSRTSWAGFILGAIFCLFLFIYIWRKDKNVSGIKRMLDRQKKIAAWIFLWLITLVIFFFPLFRIRFGIPDVSEPSYSSRILFADIAVEMIKKYPLVGIGLNNFVLRMDEFAPRDLFGYEHQPVHNIYLLIASESGIIALVAFAVILIAVLFNALRRQTFLYFMFAIMLSAILFINLFDHYWWTYPPAAYLFWILLGIAAAPKTYRDDLKTPLESLYSWSEVQK
jgi:O-antigen ligase